MFYLQDGRRARKRGDGWMQTCRAADNVERRLLQEITKKQNDNTRNITVGYLVCYVGSYKVEVTNYNYSDYYKNIVLFM